LLVLFAYLVARFVEQIVHPSAFVIFFAVVALSAWRGGLGAGMLASILSVAALAWSFADSETQASPFAMVGGMAERLILLGAVAVVVSKLRDAMLAARRREAELAAVNSELAATARRAAEDREAALALAKQREEDLAVLDTLLASSPVGLGYWDGELRAVFVNRVLAAMTGVPAESHTGRTIGEVVPRLVSIIEPLLRRTLESGEPLVGHEIDVDAPGRPAERRSWLASYYPVRAATGEVLGVGGVIVDITDRKQLEAQFRHAQKMEAVGRLAGGIAHDFNNILTAIKSYSQFLEESLEASDLRVADVREVAKAANRAAALTRQLLAFSRKQVLQPRILDLNAVVVDMERMLTRLIGEDIELVTRLDSALGSVLADPGQLEQVIMNLAVNSRDAMPDGGVLMIETAALDLPAGSKPPAPALPPGAYVMLTVRDTGIGMSAEALAHVFEPFFTTKEHGRGTGLGLATVYGIVKQSGGDARITSVPGRGTAVEIYLPRVEAVPEPLVRVGVGVELRTSTGTVLLVEDDEMLRPLMRRILEKYGYRVLEARHGGEAVRLAGEYRGELDLVITDVVMPEMGGRELAERLSSARPTVKVLYVSGYTDDVVIRQGILDPGSAFLHKPFTPADLITKTRAVLER
jgi:PAS domain S-box-containing protein